MMTDIDPLWRVQVSPPIGPFMPQVMFAPDDGAGSVLEDGGDGGGEDGESEGADTGDGDPSHRDSKDAKTADGAPDKGGEDKGAGDTEQPAMPENWRDIAANGDDDALKLLKRYGSIQGVARALVEKDRMIRSGRVRREMPDASDEAAMKEWRKAEGIPDEASQYTLPETVTDRLTDDDKPVLTAFTEYAHAKGAPQQVIDIATEWYVDTLEQMETERAEHDKAAGTETEDTLRGVWSNAEYRPNIQLANRFLESVPGLGKTFAAARTPDGRRLADNAEFVQWASDMGRDRFGDAAFASDAAEARHNSRKAEIETILKTDRKRYYKEGLDKEYSEILQREEKRRA